MNVKTQNINIKQIAKKWKDKPGSLIMLLHEIQNEIGCVPRNISLELSKILNIPLARIYEVLTFYSYFRLTPPAKNKISVCMGTACYLKGAQSLIDELENKLGVKAGEPTKDGLFEHEAVRCVGCCGQAPAVKIGDKIYNKVKPEDIEYILDEYKQKEKEIK